MITFHCKEILSEHPVGEISLEIDAGIESFVATSTGDLINSPKLLLSVLRQLKLLPRRLKQKRRGSNNCLKTQSKFIN